MDAETKHYLTVRKEFETEALGKLEKIKEKILALPDDPKKRAEDLQTLINVTDELEDVLYNWSGTIPSTRPLTLDPLDWDEEDDDDLA
jgi:hypothetical protein